MFIGKKTQYFQESVLLKVLYKFKIILVRILANYFINVKKLILKVSMNKQKLQYINTEGERSWGANTTLLQLPRKVQKSSFPMGVGGLFSFQAWRPRSAFDSHCQDHYRWAAFSS